MKKITTFTTTLLLALTFASLVNAGQWKSYGFFEKDGVQIKRVQGSEAAGKGSTWSFKWTARTASEAPYFQITYYSNLEGFQLPPEGHPAWEHFDKVKNRRNFPIGDQDKSWPKWDFKRFHR